MTTNSTVGPLSSAEPMQVARHLQRTKFSTPNNRNGLWYWRGVFYEWYGEEWKPRSVEWVESSLWNALENTTFQTINNGVTTQQRFAPNLSKVQNVLRALQAIGTLAHERVPIWMGGDDPPSTRHSISFQDLVLNCKTCALTERSDSWFDPHVLPVNWDDGVEPPHTWLRCLEEWSGGDSRWISLLQRIFGYCLLPHREYSKWFLFYGKIRGGKGTIMSVLKALMREGYMGTCLEDIAGQFGLWGIEQSRVMAINEVSEISGREGEAACRVLKSIVGRDPISINRKFEAPLRNIVVDAIPIMQANEIPKLPNKGQGLSSKMVVLPFTISFLGREDYGLLAKLLKELPSIARWAAQGAMDLEQEEDPTQKFVMPESAQMTVEDYTTINNPFDEFLDDLFERDETSFIGTKAVYENWKKWSKSFKVGQFSQAQFIHKLMQDSTWNLTKHRLSGGGVRGLRGLRFKP
jgi:putative DNA primase/helicase